MVGGHHLGHALDLLGVPGGEAHEDDDAGDGDDPVEGRAVGEDVDHRGDDEADEGHEEDVSDFGEVLVGGVAEDAHRAECAGGDEERLGDGGAGVDPENRGEHQAVDHGEQVEQPGGGGRRELLDSGRYAEDDAEFDNHHGPHEPAVGEHELLEGGAGGAEKRHERGDNQGDCHLDIDLFHGRGDHALHRCAGGIGGRIVVVHQLLF